MALVKLNTPIDEATIRSLHVGDTVSITGRLYTGRDAVHHRIHTGTVPPVDLEGQIIYHCGPVMVKECDQWVCKAAGRPRHHVKSRTSTRSSAITTSAA